MALCWFCHYGWPKPIADIYDRYIDVAGESAMHYGPAHIVWDDENFEREHVQWCLDNFDTKHAHWKEPERHTPEELAAVRASLEDMLKLTDEILDPTPEGYWENDMHPELYPPPDGMEMVRR